MPDAMSRSGGWGGRRKESDLVSMQGCRSRLWVDLQAQVVKADQGDRVLIPTQPGHSKASPPSSSPIHGCSRIIFVVSDRMLFFLYGCVGNLGALSPVCLTLQYSVTFFT